MCPLHEYVKIILLQFGRSILVCDIKNNSLISNIKHCTSQLPDCMKWTP